jgi:hypothetical protein
LSEGSDGAIALQPAHRHKLKPDADAEKRLALRPDRLVERIDHAGDAHEPLLAVGKRADAGKHDALGGKHHIGLRRHRDGERR